VSVEVAQALAQAMAGVEVAAMAGEEHLYPSRNRSRGPSTHHGPARGGRQAER
jgi:hypothetical protein